MPRSALRRIASSFAATVFALALLVAPTAAQDDLRPSRQALPTETVAMIQINQPVRTAEMLRQRTKFGQVMLTEARLDGLIDGLREQNPDQWEEMETEMGKLGLEPEDWSKLLHGNLGWGLVMQPWEGREEPLVLGLMWLNPEGGAQTAARFVEALEKGHENEPRDTRRVDLDLAGHRVRHFSVPVRQEPTYDWEQWNEGQQDPARAPGQNGGAMGLMRAMGVGGPAGGLGILPRLVGVELTQAEPNDAESRPMVDQTNVFVTRIGGRILVGHSLPVSAEHAERMLNEGRDVNLDRISGVEPLTAAFARFLQAHETGAADGFAARLAESDGIRRMNPDGEPVMEAYGHIASFLRHIPEDDMAQAEPIMAAMGVNDLAWLGFKLALDGQVMRSGMLLQAPAPRQGLIKALLDQDPLPAKPASWVPADVVGYGHVGLDLTQVYDWARAFATEQFGPMAQQQFAQADQFMQQVAQSDVRGILRALGNRHAVVTYPALPIRENMNPMAVQAATQRIGMVWDLQNAPTWDAVVRYVTSMAMMAGPQQGVTAANEQGFNGLRFNQQDLEMGLLTGHGRMAAGFGKDVLSPLLSALASPPEGQNALVNTDLYRRAREIFDARDGMWYQLTDNDRNMRSTLKMLRDSLQPMAEQAGDEAAPLRLMLQALPSDSELNGMFGVSVGDIVVRDIGLIGRGAADLPAP